MLFLAFASDLKEAIFMWGRVHAKKVKPDKTPSQDMTCGMGYYFDISNCEVCVFVRRILD
jgi:hypothetical protein